MDYNEQKIEELLRQEGQVAHPSPAAARRILHALPARRASWHWAAGILAPVMLVAVILLFHFHAQQPPSVIPPVLPDEISQAPADTDADAAADDIALADADTLAVADFDSQLDAEEAQLQQVIDTL